MFIDFMTMSSFEVDFAEESWWDGYISAKDNDVVADVDPNRSDQNRLQWLQKLHQNCVCRFYENDISSKHFFQACCLFWTEQFLYVDESTGIRPIGKEGPSSPKELFEALTATYTETINQGDMSMVRWIMPSASTMIVVKQRLDTVNEKSQEDRLYLSMLMEFWSQVFDAFNGPSAGENHTMNDENQPPLKRRRLLSRYVDRCSLLGAGLSLPEKHNLSTAFLLLSVMQRRCESWDQLETWSKELPYIFPTFTNNTVQSALALLGLNAICQDVDIEGLSILDFLRKNFASSSSTNGISILQTLQYATGLDLYNIRAALCRQIFDTVFMGDQASESKKTELLAACSTCMRSNDPYTYLDSLESNLKRKRVVGLVNPSIPEEAKTSAFPLITHLGLWLRASKADESASLVRRMDSCCILEDFVKEQARDDMWKYLLGEGRIFLDGNTEIYGYERNQTFLYEKMIAGASEGAIETMKVFYEQLADAVYQRSDATSSEKQYVLCACQKTVLRLFIQAYGLGDETVLKFTKTTTWPVVLSVPGQTHNLGPWCVTFLEKTTPIPPSLKFELTPTCTEEHDKENASINRDSIQQNGNVRLVLDLTGRFGNFESVDGTLQEHTADAIQLEPRVRREEQAPALIEGLERAASQPHTQPLQPPGVLDDGEFEGDDAVVFQGSDENSLEHRGGEMKESDVGEDIVDEEYEEAESHDSDDEDVRDDQISVGDVPVSSPQGDLGRYEASEGTYGDREEQHDYGGDESDEVGLEAEEEESSEEENADDSDDDSNEEDLAQGQNEDDAIEIGDSDSSDGRHFDRTEIDYEESEGGRTSEDDVEEIMEDEEEHLQITGKDPSMEDGEESQPLKGGKVEFEGDGDTDQVDDAEFGSSREIGSDYKDYGGSVGTGVDDIQLGVTNEELSFNREEDSYNIVESKATFTAAGLYESDVKRDIEFREAKSSAADKPLQRNDHFELKSPPRGLINSTHMDSDATDDEKERTLPVEKAETEDAAVGGEFGDTTDEDENMKANRVAEAHRREDIRQQGYNSQIEDGYYPEDTHEYTEEDGSEAIHTEDEEDERRHSMNVAVPKIQNDTQDVVLLESAEQNIPHSSDDMDMADEHTEQEDPGAESSELEDAVDKTPAAAQTIPTSTSAPDKDATTLIEIAQKTQDSHDWKTQQKDDRGSKDIMPFASSLDTNKDETFDADDEKDATEGSKNVDTEEEIVPYEEQEHAAGASLQTTAIDDDTPLEKVSEPFSAVLSLPQRTNIPGHLGGVNKSDILDEEDEDTIRDKNVEEVMKPHLNLSQDVDASMGGTEEVTTMQVEAANAQKPEVSVVASLQLGPELDYMDMTDNGIVHSTENMEVGDGLEETKFAGSVKEAGFDALDNQFPNDGKDNEEAISSGQNDDDKRNQEVQESGTLDTPQTDIITKASEEKVDREPTTKDVGDEEDRPDLQLERLLFSKGDIVVAQNPKYLDQFESAKIVKVNMDEEGNVSYDLKFLTTKDRAKNVDSDSIRPYNEDQPDDDVSSVGMTEDDSRQSEAPSTRGSSRRSSRRIKAVAESPTVPNKIETRTRRSVGDDLASVDSTPSRSRRATRKVASAALSPIAETPTRATGYSSTIQKKEKVATTQKSISVPQKIEAATATPRRSRRSKKPNKKFDDDDSTTHFESKKETSVKKPQKKYETDDSKVWQTSDAATTSTRSSTRNRIKKYDEESAVSETTSGIRAGRSHAKKSEDDVSVGSRVSTRSTRSSTRRARN